VFRRLKTYQLVVDLTVAVVFFTIAWPIEANLVPWTLTESRFGPALVALGGGSVAFVFSAALALRRASPALALGIAWAGALLQIGLGRPPGFADIAIFGVLYATAAYGSRAVYWAGLASALVGALVITVYLMAGPVFAGGGLSWQTLPLALVMLVAAAFALGLAWTIGALVRTAVRARENREAQQRAEAEAIAEQERVRIARDMHDVVAHSLAVVIAQADGARFAARTHPDAAVEALGTIAGVARGALGDVRLLLGELRHREGSAPQPELDDLDDLVAQVRGAGLDVRRTDRGDRVALGAGHQIAVYRIVQEGLTNALRHGDASEPVELELDWDAQGVAVRVENAVPAAAAADGAPEGGATGPRHGIPGMRERAELAGGTFAAEASPDGRFRVTARIPAGAAS
jgi:signal transduction histidine kinase